ncbi:LADA_0F08812g1_1 [Lachancea dasiensis]|uniref:LADA_0F08812g1_1 n=1 Tax=Lachancea dasiensis TaxID=1072105 RepID=A0A1G4JL75_9SACH|nr:LADA_0F08812g1_1 [Lachancea dasiensis]
MGERMGAEDADYSRLSHGIGCLTLRPPNLEHKNSVRNSIKSGSCEFNNPTADVMAREFLDVEQHSNKQVLSGLQTRTSHKPLADLKNENYHLKLELTQQRQELDLLLQRIKKLEVQAEANTLEWPVVKSTLPPLPYPAGKENVIEHEDGRMQASESLASAQHSSLVDYEIATHFSGSPYKSNSENIQQDADSHASSSVVGLHRNKKFFKSSVIPFLQKSIDTFQHSDVFGDDTPILQHKLDAFKNGKCTGTAKVRSMIEILDGINHFQQQCVAVLNRELENRKVSSGLENLFGRYSGSQGKSPNCDNDPKHQILSQWSEPSGTGARQQKYEGSPTHLSLKKFPQSSALIAGKPVSHPEYPSKPPVLPPAPFFEVKSSGKPWEKYSTTPKRAIEKPQMSLEVLPKEPCRISKVTAHNSESAHDTEDSRPRYHRDQLEFIPIGFDEHLLSTITSDRHFTIGEEQGVSARLTPFARAAQETEENDYDSLQAYFAEFFGDSLDQEISRSTGTNMSEFGG